MCFGTTPSFAQLQAFRKRMREAGNTCGAYWLTTPSAVKRVSQKLKSFGEEIARKAIDSP
jgi:hypothetical protein